MFKLTLSNFKCFANKTIEIPASMRSTVDNEIVSQVILLNGESGAGKTTTFEALSFLFHDSKDFAPITVNNGGKKTEVQTFVELYFPNGLCIRRQKKPNLLKITYNSIEGNHLLLDAAAEEYLHRTFGSENYWRTGAYLRQGESCGFLTMSASEKMNFLREITPSDNFEKIMRNIDNSSIRLLHEKIAQQNIFTSNNMLYNRLSTENGTKLIGATLWSPEHYENLCREHNLQVCDLVTFENAISSYYANLLNNLQKEVNSLQAEYDKSLYVLNEKKKFTEKLASYKLIPDDDFSALNSQLLQIKSIILKKKVSIQRAILLEKESDLLKKLDFWIPTQETRDTHELQYTLETLQKYENVLKIISENTAKEQLELVKKCIYSFSYANYNKAKDEFEKQEQAKTKEYNELKKKYTVLSECVTNDASDVNLENEIISYSQKILLLSSSKKLHCPKCTTSLYFHDNCLSVGENSETLEQCRARVALLTELKSVKGQLALPEFLNYIPIANVMLSTIPTTYYSKYEYEKAKSELLKYDTNSYLIAPNVVANLSLDDYKKIEIQLSSILQSYESIPKDMTLEFIQKEKENIEKLKLRKQYEFEYEAVKKELTKFASVEEDNTQIETLEKQERDIEETIRKEKQIKTEIEFYTNQLSSLQELNSEKIKSDLDAKRITYNEVYNKYQVLISNLAQQKLMKYMNEIFATMQSAQSKFYEIEKEEQSLQKIKSIVTTAEYIVLDQVLAKINDSVADILNSLFTTSILVELKSLRQLKSSDRIKPEINLEILYNGIEYSNLNKLSGGEQARISLALLIAFSKIGKIPFILIDEALSCLHSTAKENAIEAIRKHLGTKTCIIINHDSREGGVVDSVINI